MRIMFQANASSYMLLYICPLENVLLLRRFLFTVCTIRNQPMPPVNLGWLGVISCSLCMPLTTVISWRWQIPKDNPIKLIGEFCSWMDLNSPELLCDRLPIFFSNGSDLGVLFKGYSAPPPPQCSDLWVQVLRSPWKSPLYWAVYFLGSILPSAGNSITSQGCPGNANWVRHSDLWAQPLFLFVVVDFIHSLSICVFRMCCGQVHWM